MMSCQLIGCFRGLGGVLNTISWFLNLVEKHALAFLFRAAVLVFQSVPRGRGVSGSSRNYGVVPGPGNRVLCQPPLPLPLCAELLLVPLRAGHCDLAGCRAGLVQAEPEIKRYSSTE